MKKIVVFPYHPDLKVLVEHADMLKGYRLTGFISYKEDKKVIQSLNRALGVAEATDEQLMKSCDAIVLIDNYREFSNDKYYKIMDDAIANNKEIFITPLAESQLDLKRYEGKYQLLQFLPANVAGGEIKRDNASKDFLYNITVPAIGIIGQGKSCEKFKTQLLMKEALEDEYKAVMVCTNALGALFGYYTMPRFIYQVRPFKEKIIKFNHFVRDMIKAEVPDIIVIGIPEGFVPFEKYEFHHFAEYPLIVSNAVPLDFGIYCTYFMPDLELESNLKKSGEFCENRLSIPISSFVISRVTFDFHEVMEKIFFDFLDDSFLDEHYPDLKNLKMLAINIRNRNEAVRLLKTTVAQLEENLRVI